tara:strand:- start:461 stop:850 length:390 start_codon:yes stop_codon:yes gene_type:complete
MKNNLDLAKQVVDSIYVITNMPKLNTRRHPHPQLRGAIAVALSKWFYSDTIGEAMNRERTLVNHYKTKHEGNLQYWDGYKEFYEIAEAQVHSLLHRDPIEQRIHTIDRQIKHLLRERDNLLKDSEGANL